jgi:hypothetical protein
MLRHIATEGVSVNDMMIDVRNDVLHRAVLLQTCLIASRS